MWATVCQNAANKVKQQKRTEKPCNCKALEAFSNKSRGYDVGKSAKNVGFSTSNSSVETGSLYV
jgi:hypothetical protein